MPIIAVLFFWLIITALINTMFPEGYEGVSSVLGVMVIAGIFYVMLEMGGQQTQVKHNKMDRKKNKIKNEYGLDTIYSSPNSDNTAFICLDKNKRKLYIDNLLSEKDGKKAHTEKLIDIDKIRNIEIKENGVGLFNTQNASSSSLASAAVGGILFGGAGAVVGAISGQNKNNISSLSLVFHLKDFTTPIAVFDFIGDEKLKKGTAEYQKTAKRVELWLSRILLLLEEDHASPREIKQNPKPDFEGGA